MYRTTARFLRQHGGGPYGHLNDSADAALGLREVYLVTFRVADSARPVQRRESRKGSVRDAKRILAKSRAQYAQVEAGYDRKIVATRGDRKIYQRWLRENKN